MRKQRRKKNLRRAEEIAFCGTLENVFIKLVKCYHFVLSSGMLRVAQTERQSFILPLPCISRCCKNDRVGSYISLSHKLNEIRHIWFCQRNDIRETHGKKLENVTSITVHPHKSKRYKILLQSLLLFICKKRRSKNKTSPFCFPNAHCSKFPFLRKALCHNANNKI